MNQACMLITALRRNKGFLGYAKHSTTGLSTIGRQVTFSDQMYVVEIGEPRDGLYLQKKTKAWYRQAASNGEHEVFSHLRKP